MKFALSAFKAMAEENPACAGSSIHSESVPIQYVANQHNEIGHKVTKVVT